MACSWNIIGQTSAPVDRPGLFFILFETALGRSTVLCGGSKLAQCA